MSAELSYIKTKDNRIICAQCQKMSVQPIYSSMRAFRRHYRLHHVKLPDTRQKIIAVPRDTHASDGYSADKITLLEKQVQDLTNQLQAVIRTPTGIDQQLKTISDEIRALRAQPLSSHITNNNNINNNITIYFNKDLKYYPELVKLLGRQKTCDYLLFKMPESRDLFGVLDTLFMRDGISTCPIRVDDDDEFIVARNTDEYVRDPTGELIDRENKSKLQDAILSAYIDSTKHLDEECEKIRKNRVNGEYTEKDIETINKRFDGAIEPSRPYEVIDIMNGIKPKRKDFDKLRKICPKIVKKLII